MCNGAYGAGGSCGLGRAGFDTWSIGTITTSGSNGGIFLWMVSCFCLVSCFSFHRFLLCSGFGVDGPLLAISDLV